MKLKTANQIIAHEFDGEPNFMTPEVIETGFISEPYIAYEFSKGEGLDRQPIYGVSVVEWLGGNAGTKRLIELSKMFHAERFARRYIETLKGMMK